MGLLLLALFIAVIALAILYYRKSKAFREIYERVRGIVDIEAETKKVQRQYAQLVNNQNRETEKLRQDYTDKHAIYEQLLNELKIVEEDLEDISYGLYKPHFDFDTSEQYKIELAKIRNDQKQLLRDKEAATCGQEWEVQGSKREGKKMTDRTIKLMLRAFNGECDSAITKVTWNNVLRMLERVKKAYEAINKLGEPLHIILSDYYLDLKCAEIRLAYEYEQKHHEEKEEQRRIKEQMREEEKVRREIEKAHEQAEKEENEYQLALEQARKEMEEATEEEMDKMNEKIALLEKQLSEAHELKERVISRAQLTKSGHVYVVSNVGSFGAKVFKIGLTRRLDPLLRVKELGDASVPFPFDVHAIIYSENAPDLENKLHEYFDSRRVNLTNRRKEFFRARLEEIETAVVGLQGQIEFTKIAEAQEYRETLAIREAAKQGGQMRPEPEKKPLPVTL